VPFTDAIAFQSAVVPVVEIGVIKPKETLENRGQLSEHCQRFGLKIAGENVALIGSLALTAIGWASDGKPATTSSNLLKFVVGDLLDLAGLIAHQIGLPYFKSRFLGNRDRISIVLLESSLESGIVCKHRQEGVELLFRHQSLKMTD